MGAQVIIIKDTGEESLYKLLHVRNRYNQALVYTRGGRQNFTLLKQTGCTEVQEIKFCIFCLVYIKGKKQRDKL